MNSDGTVDLRIDGGVTVSPDNIKACRLTCQNDCSPQVWRIVFADVDFGDCASCYKELALRLMQDRNSRYDYLSYTPSMSDITVPYSPPGGAQGVVTAAALALYFSQSLTAGATQHTNGLDYFGITTQFATTNVANDTLILTARCPIRFTPLLSERSLALPVAEKPQFTMIATGIDANNTRELLLQQFGVLTDHVIGQDPSLANKAFFSTCESICVLDLDGCIDACSPFAQENLVFNGTAGAPLALRIYINATPSSDYTAFKDALESAFTPCSDNDISTSSIPAGGTALATVSAAAININTAFATAVAANTGFHGPYQLSLTSGGIVRFAITLPEGLESNVALAVGGIVFQLNEIFPQGTFAYSGTTITASGAAVAGGSPVWRISVP